MVSKLPGNKSDLEYFLTKIPSQLRPESHIESHFLDNKFSFILDGFHLLEANILNLLVEDDDVREENV